MSRIIEALRFHATHSPLRVAVQDENTTLSYAQLLKEVEHLAERLLASAPKCIAILADNGSAWAVADLAAQLADIPAIPLPLFFSPGQIAHVIKNAGIDQILTDQPERVSAALPENSLVSEPFHTSLRMVRLLASNSNNTLPPGTQKITFTSGTTGEPKGVCLGLNEMATVAESLLVASAADRADRHLCLLPLATLLENIGGIYTPLLAGATICLPKLATVGLSGSSGLDVIRMAAALREWNASSAIMVPQMLQSLVAAGQAGIPMPSSLRYLAVGGAPVSEALLEAARQLGLPVHQGYGLSECSSVVAVSSPGEERSGSVGRPLPHLKLTFATDGEIKIHGVTWRGYLGDTPSAEDHTCIATGDIGYLDDDGFLFLTGRKKNIFITSFGRNVAPEWVESELVSHFPILQAAVFGEARDFNNAIIFAHPQATVKEIAAAVALANQQLPDYARIGAWISAHAPFATGNGMATANGRLRRNNIQEAYSDQINALYQHQFETESNELLPAA